MPKLSGLSSLIQSTCDNGGSALTGHAIMPLRPVGRKVNEGIFLTCAGSVKEDILFSILYFKLGIQFNFLCSFHLFDEKYSRTVILWNIITMQNNYFLFEYILNVFFSVMQTVFSVTWSFRNHSNMLININGCGFWWTKFTKNSNWFIYIYRLCTTSGCAIYYIACIYKFEHKCVRN